MRITGYSEPKNESEKLFQLAERVRELERETLSLRDRLDRHDKIFAQLRKLVKLDLELASIGVTGDDLNRPHTT